MRTTISETISDNAQIRSGSTSTANCQDAAAGWIAIGDILIPQEAKATYEAMKTASSEDLRAAQLESGAPVPPEAMAELIRMKEACQRVLAYSTEDLRLLLFAGLAWPEHVQQRQVGPAQMAA